MSGATQNRLRHQGLPPKGRLDQTLVPIINQLNLSRGLLFNL